MGKRPKVGLPSNNRKPTKSIKTKPTLNNEVLQLKDIVKIPLRLIFDPKYFWVLGGMVLFGEAILNIFIIHNVSYTEIDWKAYMEQVEGFLHGERDYYQLKGDTGPLVYPAGFLYTYSLFYYLTSYGINIRIAQYIFSVIYLVTQYIVFHIYATSKKMPPFVLVLLCLSKRLHSIYVLRCFNDPVAMLFMYGCILALIYRKFTLSSLLYSLALSIKMNVLLFLPAFGIILWQLLGAYFTLLQIGLIILVQLAIGYPFLSTYPASYLSRAFEFSRVFDYKWTVNWRMIDEKLFTSTDFAKLLLMGHISLLLIFMLRQWCQKNGGLILTFIRGFKFNQTVELTNDDIIYTMFTSNFIGVIFARSLHYQFYSWYYHTLPYLLFQSCWISVQFEQYRSQIRLFLLATIEGCWLTFPSTDNSSWTLLACHIVIIMGLLQYDDKDDYKVPSYLLEDQKEKEE
ncbi:unnamed protein product [Cunninghamella blakesleeana]